MNSPKFESLLSPGSRTFQDDIIESPQQTFSPPKTPKKVHKHGKHHKHKHKHKDKEDLPFSLPKLARKVPAKPTFLEISLASLKVPNSVKFNSIKTHYTDDPETRILGDVLSERVANKHRPESLFDLLDHGVSISHHHNLDLAHKAFDTPLSIYRKNPVYENLFSMRSEAYKVPKFTTKLDVNPKSDI
jgi:hypothetical protein